MSAILFGSISTIADTSELQREAFNSAFETHGLEWKWSGADYSAMLEKSGGEDRIADYAKARGEEVDAAAVHRTKTDLFQESLVEGDLRARPGVVDTIREGREAGLKFGLVTTTSEQNVSSLLDALSDEIAEGDFDIVVDASKVDKPKPDAASYAYALESLGEAATDCTAIEDNLGGAQAAAAAGLKCVAFPNENTAGHDFGSTADRRVDRISLDELRTLIPSA